jgi:hypothetical protein
LGQKSAALRARRSALANVELGAVVGCALTWTLPALAAMASPASMAAEPAALIYRTGEEVVFEVTSNGLSRITFQGRSLATGEWSVFNAESWFSHGATNGPVRSGRFQERTLEVLSPAHAIVRQRKDDLVCIFDYRFTGEDVTISARVENHHPDAPIEVTGFSGLTFTFDRPPAGLHHAMHPRRSSTSTPTIRAIGRCSGAALTP